MNHQNPSAHSRSKPFLFAIVFAACLSVSAQQTPPPTPVDDKALAESVQELRQQVKELRAAIVEMKTEADQYRTESTELRKELESIRQTAPVSSANPQSPEAAPASSLDERVSAVEENTQLLESEIRNQYQTKVESASKYRVRLSGLVLLNLFSNNGFVNNQDFPTYAASGSIYGESRTFGATLRQSELGLEVFGPEIAGAKSSGQIQVDFGGGFAPGAFDGVNSGLLRLRTASARLDWENTSVIAGQDNLFISPLSPTSFASLVIPSFGYSGNLWAWTPQLRIEHKINLAENQYATVQAGILDNVTGEPASSFDRLPLAGESVGQPAYAARTSWTRVINGRPLTIGASGYLSRQHWGPDWDVTGWAAASDWRIPLSSRVELSGELYRGLAVGGIGGGIGESVLFSGNPQSPGFRPVNSAGGWSQFKVLASQKLEFNGVFGMDNPFSSDIHALAFPVSAYPNEVLTANRSEMVNFIFRPRSDLLLSGEYRHLHTAQIGALNTADQVNLVMGVLF